MKQRTTYLVSDTLATHPDNFDISPTSLQIKSLHAAREDRLAIGYDELSAEIQDVLKQCNELLIRWSTGRPYTSVDPFAARVPAGLHIHLRPQRDVVPSICDTVNVAFGITDCRGFAESFIPISGVENAYQFYAPVRSIDMFATFVADHLCTGMNSWECATGVESADYVDLKWDAISQMIVVNTFWSKSGEPQGAVAVNVQEPRNIEVGVLGNDRPIAEESLTMGGVLHVVGKDDRMEPVMFTFPARHHSSPATYSLTTSKPPGLHPKLQLSIAHTQPLKAPGDECTLNAYFTLPRGLFIDKYQLSPTNPQLLESLNIKRILGVNGETDLEAPVWASKRWGSSLLVEVDTARASNGLDMELPLHLRYLEPKHDSTLSEVNFTMPAVFWACRSEEWSKMTMYYHLSPSEDAWKSVPVPVLDLQQAMLVKIGTVVVIVSGFLWVVWKTCAAFTGGKKVGAGEKKTQ